jgi:hypothetical protein
MPGSHLEWQHEKKTSTLRSIAKYINGYNVGLDIFGRAFKLPIPSNIVRPYGKK